MTLNNEGKKGNTIISSSYNLKHLSSEKITGGSFFLLPDLVFEDLNYIYMIFRKGVEIFVRNLLNIVQILQTNVTVSSCKHE